MTIYEKAAALCRAKPVTVVEAVLLCSLAFAAGWTLAFGLAGSAVAAMPV